MVVTARRVDDADESSIGSDQGSERRLNLLRQAVAHIATAADERALLDALGHALVPALAKRCIIDLVGEGTCKRVFIMPVKGEDAAEAVLQDARSEVIATGRAKLIRSPRGIRPIQVLPLIVQSRVVGVIALHHARDIEDVDLDLALELTKLAGVLLQGIRSHGEAEGARRLRASHAEAEADSARLALYREIFRGSDDGIAVIALDGSYLEQNDAHRMMLGYGDEALQDATPAIHLGETTFAHIAEVLEREGRYRGEHVSRRHDGRLVDIELVAFTVRDAHGEPRFHVGVKRDVTHRKRVESDLHRTIRRLRAIYRLSEATADARTLQEMHEACLTCIVETLEVERAAILLADENGLMRFQAWRGLAGTHRASVAGCSPWPADCVDPQPIVVSDALADPAFSIHAATLRHENVRALVFIPLVHDGALVGKVMLCDKGPRSFSGDELKLGKLIARHIAAGIQRARAAEALRESHALLHAVTEGIEAAVFMKDLEGKYRFINGGAAAYMNVDPGEILGRDDAEVFDPETARELQQGDEAVMKMGVTRHYEQTLTRETHARTFLTTKSPHRDAAGRIVGVLGLAYDITLRKHMEDELQRRLAVENALAHISFRFIAPADLDTCIEETLADLGSLTGATAAYASVLAQHGGPARRHAWHASEAGELQDPPFDLASMPKSWRVRLGAGSHVVVTDMGSAGDDVGRELLEAANASALVILPVFTRDGLMGVLTLKHDVIRTWHEHELRMLEIAASILGTSVQRHAAEARLRLSEERFRLLSTASPVGVFVTDVDGRITYANRRCATIIGHDGIVGQAWHAFVDVDTAQAEASETWTLHASGTVPFSRVLPILSKGEPRWAHLRAAYLQNEDGRHVGYVGTIEDVSDLRRAQEELQTSRQQLAVSEKMSALGTLVSGVAHEIRTPLTYVANHLHIIRHRMERDDPQMKALREWLEPHAVGALEGVDRINHLVHDLRRFTQLDLGERAQLDLAAVVDEAVHLFRTTHRGQVHVDARLAPVPSLAMNKVQIQQVVINLLQNASEAMENRGTIRVATRQTATGHVRLVVEDEGPGIPPDVKKHALEPFYTTKRDGTGLGLSIVDRIVREHAGRLRFEDAGPGTRVVVELARPAA